MIRLNDIINDLTEVALKHSKWAFSRYYKKGKMFRLPDLDGAYHVITYSSLEKPQTIRHEPSEGKTIGKGLYLVVWVFDKRKGEWLDRCDYFIDGDRKMMSELVTLMRPNQLVSKAELWGIIKHVKEEIINKRRLMKRAKIDLRQPTEVSIMAKFKLLRLSMAIDELVTTYAQLFSYFKDD